MKFFLDTSFAIALSSITDQHHARAVQLAHQLQASQARLVTTQAILLEIGNALSKSKYRMGAIQVFQVDQVGTGQCPVPTAGIDRSRCIYLNIKKTVFL